MKNVPWAFFPLTGLIAFVVFFSLTAPQAFAQTPSSSVVQPSFFPLAPCPTCSNPADPIISGAPDIPNVSNAPEPSVSGNPAPSGDPCQANNASITGDNAWHHHRHHRHQGGVSKSADGILQLLLELINKLIELLGGTPIAMPEIPANPDQPDVQNPVDPCNPANAQPGVSAVPQPSSTVPGVTYAPAPSTTQPGVTSGPGTTSVPAPSTAQPSGTTAAGCTQADIQKLVDSVSQANITANLKEIVQDDTKPTPNELITRGDGTAGNATKTNWIKTVMDGYGYTSVLMPDNDQGNNVIATLTGTDQNSAFSVSSHLDDMSESVDTLAPGADDNGSGTVAVMEIARVLKTLPATCLKYNIDFAAFNAEETSMGGSEAYVKSMSGKTVKGNFNMDMVGTAGGFHANSNSTLDQPLRDKMVEMNTKYNIGASLVAGTGGSGIDSESFWGANMPSLNIEEETFSSVYHTTNDKTDKIDFAQITSLAKIVVATLAELESQ